MADTRVIRETPRGRVIIVRTSGGKLISKLIWNDNIKRFNGQYSRAQVWLDNAVLKDSNYYAPKLTGALQKTGILGTTLGEGVAQWIAPYSRYLYYKKAMSGPKYGPKYYNGKELHINKSENPNAQAFWFEAAKAQNKSIWIRGVQTLAAGGR